MVIPVLRRLLVLQPNTLSVLYRRWSARSYQGSRKVFNTIVKHFRRIFGKSARSCSIDNIRNYSFRFASDWFIKFFLLSSDGFSVRGDVVQTTYCCCCCVSVLPIDCCFCESSDLLFMSLSVEDIFLN